MKFLTSGKVKDIYDYDRDLLLFKFSDRVSAFDVKFNQDIPRKGEILCKFAEFWFDSLDVPNHFVRRISNTELLVKKMDMLPLECVVRGYFYGSIISRWKDGTVKLPDGTDTTIAAKLPEPIFDPTTKSEHDVPVDKNTSISMDLVTEEQFDTLCTKSITIYQQMASIADAAGFILADLKLEFGILDDSIILCDSVGPDEYRLWPKKSYSVGKTQEAHDKQILRDWLTEYGYSKQFEIARSSGKDPVPPKIPSDIITKMTDRYVSSYQKITGHTV